MGIHTLVVFAAAESGEPTAVTTNTHLLLSYSKHSAIGLTAIDGIRRFDLLEQRLFEALTRLEEHGIQTRDLLGIKDDAPADPLPEPNREEVSA